MPLWFKDLNTFSKKTEQNKGEIIHSTMSCIKKVLWSGAQVRGKGDTNPPSDSSKGDSCTFFNMIREVVGKEMTYSGISAGGAH